MSRSLDDLTEELKDLLTGKRSPEGCHEELFARYYNGAIIGTTLYDIITQEQDIVELTSLELTCMMLGYSLGQYYLETQVPYNETLN